MAEATKRTCQTTTCAMRGLEVTTDKIDCLVCGKPLKRTGLGDLLGGFFTGFGTKL